MNTRTSMAAVTVAPDSGALLTQEKGVGGTMPVAT